MGKVCENCRKFDLYFDHETKFTCDVEENQLMQERRRNETCATNSVS